MVLLLAAAILASAAVLLYLTRNITFLLDDWEFLVYRRGFTEHALLDPHNEHLILGPILVYKALLGLFGMDSARPFQVVSTIAFLTSAALLFAWLRGRVDQWLALGAVILVLFLGAAWEDLLWAFQIGYFVSMAAGLAMLLALKRETAVADRVACAALVVSLVFSSVGIPFMIGAAVAIGTAPGWRNRLYVVVIPALLYGLWWIGWGHTAESHLSAHNLANAPVYVFDAIGSAFSSLLGLQTPRDEAGVGAYDWGRPLAVLFVALAGWRLYRIGSVPRWLWVVGAIALSFWLLSAVNQFPGRAPSSSRYQYVGAILVLLLAAELLRGIEVRAPALALAGAVGALAVASSISFLSQSSASYEGTSDLIKADLGAVEIARDTADPGFVLSEDLAGTGYVGVSAEAYLSAVDAFGSPADTPEQIAAAPEPAREAADRVLAGALRIAVAPAAAGTAAGCRRVDPAGATAVAELPPGGAVVRGSPGAATDLRLRRFATGSFPIGAGQLAGGQSVSIGIPPDRSTVPWQLQLSGGGAVAVCPEPGA
ncbi:MAG: hypothetical protein QOI10_627 [Solirubrobacterales bacterium]|nr:hypothetical protein [Solirubrobacterales bacterium]